MKKYYALTSAAVTEREGKNQALLREMIPECMVLLENDGVLPLDVGKNRKLALYGNGARNTVKGGTGSGDVNARETVGVEAGLRAAGFDIVSAEWLDDYEKTCLRARNEYLKAVREESEERGIPTSMIMFEKTYADPELPPFPEADRKKTDTAIFVLARNSGEGKDRSCTEGDYLLSENEKERIRYLAEQYPRFIVLLNIGGAIDMRFLKSVPGIGAILLIGQTGNAGVHAVADVLAGKSVPSGKLTDTWAERYEDYPGSGEFSHNNGNVDEEYYREGVYVGYRYFDSMGIEPSYCFGYGKGYTDFSFRINAVSVRRQEIRLDVEVQNTGEKYGGKEVIQAYFLPPEGELDKPKQQLIAFAKTGYLAPSGRETLRLSFRAEDMASYNPARGAWILEKGDYLIRVGNSSRNTRDAAVLSLEKTVVTDKVKRLFQEAEDREIEDLKAPFVLREAPDGAVRLILDAGEIPFRENIYTETRKISPQILPDEEPEVYLTLTDVKEGRASLEELVAQMTEEEMAVLCVGSFRRGEGGADVIGSASSRVPGAAADTTSQLEGGRKIPVLTMADGPAGLRLQPHFMTDRDGNLLPGGQTRGMETTPFPEDIPEGAVDYYQYCTAFPTATALAQSWNMELLEKVGGMVGEEMELYHIHIWLAPGMNIHRNPLCGRNFEYYSEDPLLTGKCASAVTRGVQGFPGRGVTLKHYAANNQEDNRMFCNCHVSERALREIYLKGFEIAVREAKPYAIMTSYNLLNGIHTANHRGLLQAAARDEWGFDGVFMTDWFASQDTVFLGFSSEKYPWSSSVDCIYAGNDLQMPGCAQNVEDILLAVREGDRITRGDLQFCAGNILKLILKTGKAL